MDAPTKNEICDIQPAECEKASRVILYCFILDETAG